MAVSKIIRALNSDLRREILKIIMVEPKTVAEILRDLERRGFEIKYRTTVFRALEKLVDAGLVKKYYIQGRGLCYRSLYTCITININADEVQFKST